MAYKKLKANVSIFIDTRKTKKSGAYPLKLRVCYKRKAKLFSIKKAEVQESQIENLFSAKPVKALRETQLEMQAMQTKANTIINNMQLFSWEEFEKQLFEKLKDEDSLYDDFETVIGRIESEGRIATAMAYRNTLNGIKKYKPGKTFVHSEITPQFLMGLEKWMVDKGRSVTTVSIYARCLRAILNEAIQRGKISRDSYPFGRYRYMIPSKKNVKKALNKVTLSKIYNYDAGENEKQQRAKDYWIFSYLCNGANLKDICNLRIRDIKDDRITFLRAKTSSTSHVQKPIVTILTEPMKEIIERQGSLDGEEDDYVFPVLKKTMNPRQQLFKIRDQIKFINDYMKEIGTALEIPVKVTTYTARHSFATMLKRSGAPTEFISEAMGHSGKKTTEVYLDSFEDKDKAKWAGVLTDF
jgi:integrase/recombinase XerD